MATWLATAWALVRMRLLDSGAMTKPVAVHLVCWHICQGLEKLGLQKQTAAATAVVKQETS
jgi:hypothetical protein